MNEARAATRNIVLRELSPKDYEKITSAAERVTLATKDEIWQANQPIKNVYFPETAVISLVTLLDAGSIEAITIGHDGFVGLPVFHGPRSTVTHANCQMPGESWRLNADAFVKLCGEMPELRRALNRYSQLVIETISQSAACNRVHVIEERCARWLLMSHDRVANNEIPLTQEFLAQMLGVRRPGVTVAIGILQRAGLIAHGRGRITVTNRQGLEAASCECYAAIKRREQILHHEMRST
ncbi:MAG: Crp/Fnr family transcriptional regulator [Gemmatimonadaceae bacterium]